MLLYHFGTKDQLVADVLRTSIDRSVNHVMALAPSTGLHGAVIDLWAAMQTPPTDRCNRLYVEAAALGLLGREPYASAVRAGNSRWMEALILHLTRSGVERDRAARAAEILDAAFMGFQLDLPLDLDPETRQRAVADLAEMLAALS